MHDVLYDSDLVFIMFFLFKKNFFADNKDLAIDGPVIKSRELFISDATDTYPVSVLRGHCHVDHYADIHAVRDFTPEENSFFYILGLVVIYLIFLEKVLRE